MPAILIWVLAGYLATLLIIPLGMWLYSLRVVYLRGYIRILFTDPATKVVTPVLTRIKADQTNVTFPHGTYDLDDDAVRYIGKFRLPFYEFVMDRSESLFVGMTGEEVKEIAEKAIATQIENEDPKKPLTEKDKITKPVLVDEERVVAFSPRVAAIGFKNVAKNVAMSQLIAAFRKGLLNPSNMVMLVGIILLIAIIASAAYLGNNQNQILDAMGIK